MVPDSRDVAATIVSDHSQPWNKQTEATVVRKIDFALIPFMWIGYGLVYYDKGEQVHSWGFREVC